MKAKTILSVAGCLAMGSISAWAGDLDPRQLARCEVELEQHYGRVVDVRLVSRQRFQEGSRLKVAVQLRQPETGNYAVEFATCWIDSGDTDMADRLADSAIAASDSGAGER